MNPFKYVIVALTFFLAPLCTWGQALAQGAVTNAKFGAGFGCPAPAAWQMKNGVATCATSTSSGDSSGSGTTPADSTTPHSKTIKVYGINSADGSAMQVATATMYFYPVTSPVCYVKKKVTANCAYVDFAYIDKSGCNYQENYQSSSGAVIATEANLTNSGSFNFYPDQSASTAYDYYIKAQGVLLYGGDSSSWRNCAGDGSSG